MKARVYTPRTVTGTILTIALHLKKQKALLCAELVQYGTDIIPAQFLSIYDSQNDQQL